MPFPVHAAQLPAFFEQDGPDVREAGWWEDYLLKSSSVKTRLPWLIEANGPTGTAKILGVSRASVYRTIQRNRLTDALTKNLRHHLLATTGAPEHAMEERSDTQAAQTRKEPQAEIFQLKQQLEQRDRQLAEQERELADLAAKAASPESTDKGADPDMRVLAAAPSLAAPTADSSNEPEGGPGVNSSRPNAERELPATRPAWPASTGRRRYATLVTEVPGREGAQGYGAAAPLVREWWEVKQVQHVASNRLDRALTEERRLVLEMDMIENYNLTLPPEERPYYELLRRRELELRWRAVQWAHLQRRRAQRSWLLVKVLTLGLCKVAPPIWPSAPTKKK